MIKKAAVIIAVFIFITALGTLKVFASSSVETVIGADRMDEADRAIEDAVDGNEILEDVTFSGLVKAVVSGRMDFSLSTVIDIVTRLFFSEVRSCAGMLAPLFTAAILGAVLKNISSSFNSKAVAELSFYVCYMVMIFIVMDMFAVAGKLVTETLDVLRDTSAAVMPVFYTLMAVSGQYTGAYIMGPFTAAATVFMSVFSKAVLVPALGLAVTLEIVNNLTERPALGKMSELIKKGSGRILKIIAGGFMAFISLQKIGTAASDKLAGRAAKAAVGAVPVVGGVMEGAVETAAAMTSAIKSSTAVAAVIFIAAVCALPLIKIFVIMVIYKFTAAVIEPVGESRFVKCLSSVGDYTGLLLSTLFAAMVMFMFAVIILVGLT